MDLHKLLIRQLTRLDIDSHSPPSNPEKWQSLLERISNTYIEADQERYLLERSTEISSRELLGLNQKLEDAQHIARLGYWFYDKETGQTILSNELYNLFGLDPTQSASRYEQLMHLVHEKDRGLVKEVMEKAFSEGIEFEIEIRMKNSKGDYRWYYVIGYPLLKEEKNVQLTGIAMDITQRKKTEEEISLLHQQLLASARRAGMADVATAILHNVGNILNSANVSLGVLHESINKPHYKKFFAVINMIKDHLSLVEEYLTQDPKGKLIPEYIVTAAEIIQDEYKIFHEEVANLNQHLQHIKDIVRMQQALSGVSGVTEKVFLPEVLDSALKMTGGMVPSRNFKIKTEYEETPFILIDKNKLLQILVNIIQNAKDAALGNFATSEKEIILSIKKDDALQDMVMIIVSDNGVGIAPENLTKIFSFGYTNKKNGHGFGLHTSALAANEIGGSLQVKSDGLGKGATFTLNLPLVN